MFPSIFLESKGLALGLASLKPVVLKVGEGGTESNQTLQIRTVY